MVSETVSQIENELRVWSFRSFYGEAFIRTPDFYDWKILYQKSHEIPSQAQIFGEGQSYNQTFFSEIDSFCPVLFLRHQLYRNLGYSNGFRDYFTGFRRSCSRLGYAGFPIQSCRGNHVTFVPTFSGK